MATLTKANEELFRRGPDECFSSFEALQRHCQAQQANSRDLWERFQDLTLTHDLTFCADGAELTSSRTRWRSPALAARSRSLRSSMP